MTINFDIADANQVISYDSGTQKIVIATDSTSVWDTEFVTTVEFVISDDYVTKTVPVPTTIELYDCHTSLNVLTNAPISTDPSLNLKHVIDYSATSDEPPNAWADFTMDGETEAWCDIDWYKVSCTGPDS